MRQYLLSVLSLTIFALAFQPANAQSLGQLKRVELSKSEFAALPRAIKKQLQESAHDLAQIWGDTILEGDYYAENKVRLDLVEKLIKADKHVGYRITYSSKAWDTSDCDFDSEVQSSLAQCHEGRIVESGFLSLDFGQASQDFAAFAEFVEQ